MFPVRAAFLLCLAAFAVSAAFPVVAPAAYRDTVMADNPAGYWRLEETSGPLGANEIAGGQRARFFQHPLLGDDGAFAGTRAITAGGRSLVEIASPVRSGDAATYELWMRIHPGFDGTSYEGILELPGVWGLWVHNGALVGGCTQGAWMSGPHVADGGWHHVAARFEDGRWSVFSDGVKLGDEPCHVPIQNGRLIGGWGGGRAFVQPLPRSLDEIAVYPRALTDAELAAHAAARTTADEEAVGTRPPLTGGPYAGAVLADQPYAYYRLDDRPWNADGSPSLQVTDSSINGRHGVMHLGGMDRAPGPITSEASNLSMRPRGHTFAVPGAPAADLTVEAWVKLAQNDSANSILGGGRLHMYFNGPELVVLPFGQVTLDDGKWNDRAWHHIVVTKDTAADELRVYRDGVLLRVMPDANDAPLLGDSQLVVGGGDPETAGYCLDEVAVYEGALSESRIASHYAAADAEDARGGCGGTSDVIADDRPPVPVNESAPRVRGVAAPGNQIWCDPGEWTGLPNDFRYQWRSNGIDIPLGTEWSRIVSPADHGNELTCAVVAVGTGGLSAEAVSGPLSASGRPEAPGAPRLVAGTTDVRSSYELEWPPTPSTPVPAEGYVLQRQIGGGPWVTVTATPAAPRALVFSEPEGALRYRVYATAGGAESELSPPSDPIVVDRTPPRHALLNVSTAPAWTSPAGDEWYLDSASGTWAADGDPDLPDGTPGSGVDPATVPGPVTRSTTGEHEFVARLRDRAGNEQLTIRKLRVDASAPTLALACPAGAHVGVENSVPVTAADLGSGLDAPVPQQLPIDVSTAGTRTITHTVRDHVGHAVTRSCTVAVKHRPPNTPFVSAGANPGRGNLTVSWTRPAGATLPAVYVLEARDANDAGWTEVYRGTAESRTWSTFSPLAQGTWTFRVRAEDPNWDPAPSGTSAPVVSDRVDPNDHTAVTDRAPERDTTGTTNDWWRDTVTVSFTGSDPALPDGSPGSGVDPASVADQTFATHGTHTATATPRDRAGNVGNAVSRTVRVDATDPVVTIDCPSSPVVQDDSEEADWDASDTGSGLATAASGDVDLDTSAIGIRTATSPVARDRVGHTATDTCTYTVIYDWDGFYEPVFNPGTVNDVDAGLIVPMIFSLNGDRGLSVLAGTPTTAPSSCGGTKRDVDWTLPPTWPTGLQYLSQYEVYLWPFQTQTSWRNTCRTLTVTLADGTTHRATFRFQ